jgi:hypothetical protein
MDSAVRLADARANGGRFGGVAGLAVVVALGVGPRAAHGSPAARELPSSRAEVPSVVAGADASRLDLTGKWLLKHVVHRSGRSGYRGLVLLFRVDLVQRGDRVTGTAVKWRENGRLVAPGARSVLRIDGTVRGHEITGRFVETGGRRPSRGSFRWTYSVREGWLSGSFATDISSASGESTAIAIG